jgi:predicted ATPase/class 3 adenylate cyclase
MLTPMTELPAGTVTFLFTDISGSTTMLRELGADAYAVELAAHRRIVREACVGSGGVEVDITGDAFFFAFQRAADAVLAAQAVQDGLAEGRTRVRIGLHTGEPLLTADGFYVGMDVHRAARIAASGHGGQVLVSQVTRELVPEIEFLDLGEQRLKDLTRPERIFQLGFDEFPPVKSLNRTNLPIAAHPLVDREVEQAELLELMREHRLVTLIGPGGSGKTRLALQIAAELLGEVVDGVFFVNLAGFSDPAQVVPAVLQLFGSQEPEAAATARGLVVLDNFEHLMEAATAVAQLLGEAPELRLLVTSRGPLRVSGEVEYPLEPLPQDAAVELFLERARSQSRHFEPSETIALIVDRLDRLPLALELAAARLRLLDPPALLDRLDARLSLLTQGQRDLPERQRTLEATIAWSYDLLTPEAQALFARLAIFAGTFSLEAAERVAGGDLDLLERLVDASLMKPIGENRFLLLETIREFSGSRLDDAERAELVARHAAYYLELAESLAPRLTGADGPALIAQLDADHPNLRVALDNLDSPDELARMTSALWRFWLVRGHFHEAQTRIERVLALELDDAKRADLQYELGAILISRGRSAEGERACESALELYRGVDNKRGEAKALMALGHSTGDRGEWEWARSYYEQAIALSRAIGEELDVAGGLGDLAGLLLHVGKADEALPIAAESVEVQRRLGFEQGAAVVQTTQAYAHLMTGDQDRARELFVESMLIAHRGGYQHGLVYCLNGLGRLFCESDDLDRAVQAFTAAHRLQVEIGIEHDPDDALVADARAGLEQRLGASVADSAPEGLELDAVVAALAETPARR